MYCLYVTYHQESFEYTEHLANVKQLTTYMFCNTCMYLGAVGAQVWVFKNTDHKAGNGYLPYR
jgi:hypothetical protein